MGSHLVAVFLAIVHCHVSLRISTMSSPVGLPLSDDSLDLHADQRGRIIGSCVAIFVITDVFVFLRLVSRKLARAGYWVSDSNAE